MIATRKQLDLLQKRTDERIYTQAELRRDLEARVFALEQKIAVAAAKGLATFRPGTHVSYMPVGYLGYRPNIRWSGRVIPLPVGARTHGNSGDPLVWVMRDGDNAIRGCYAHNLVRR